MGSDNLEQCISLLEGELTPALVERVVRGLLQQRTDGASGVGAVTLVMHLAGDFTQRYADIMWIYQRLRPALLAAVEQNPSLQFIEGG